MKKLTIVLSALLLFGCNIQQRQIRRLDELSVRQRPEFNRLANLYNPCFPLKGKTDTVITTNTVSIKGDTVKTTSHDTVKITIRLPGKTTTTIKAFHDTVENFRVIAVLNDQIDLWKKNASDAKDALIKSQQQLADEKATSSKFKWLFYGLLSAVIIYCGLKIYTAITGGASLGIVKKIL